MREKIKTTLTQIFCFHVVVVQHILVQPDPFYFQ